MTDAHDHYDQYHQTYRHIESKLDTLREAFLAADRTTQRIVLFQADLYSLISANTRVEAHEGGYLDALGASDRDDYRDAFYDNNVLYHNNKADYVEQNLATVDYDAQAERLEEGNLDAVHRQKVDNVQGLGVRKAAFSLAMLGFTEKMCIDANVASYFDLDTEKDVYSGVVVDRYERQCGRLRSKDPFLAQKTSPFIFQWVIFDCERVGRPTMHDTWFGSIGDALDIQLL